MAGFDCEVQLCWDLLLELDFAYSLKESKANEPKKSAKVMVSGFSGHF